MSLIDCTEGRIDLLDLFASFNFRTGVQFAGEQVEKQRRAIDHGRFSAMSRRIFHIVIALVLIASAVSPFVESALNSHDNVFSTGYDGESTLAIIVLLLELVLSLASLLVFFLPNVQLKERVDTEHPCLTSASGFRVSIPDFSPSVPLRI